MYCIYMIYANIEHEISNLKQTTMETNKTYRLLILCATFVLFSLTTIWGQDASQGSSEISVPEDILKSYVGRYDYGQGMVNIITLEDGQLYAQATAEPNFPIFPSSDEEFYWKVIQARIKFVTDENGIVTHAIHFQNGMQINCPKLKEEEPVAVDPAIFNNYVGRYDAGSNGIIVITKEDNKLFGQGANLPVYQLLPASETEYFLREINARVTFTANEENTTDSAVINLAGNVFTAVKMQE